MIVQALVKQAFSDKELAEKIFLTSANSINVARWLPQQIYYFLAWKQWKNKLKYRRSFHYSQWKFRKYLCRIAGISFRSSGKTLAVTIAACNVNAVIPEYLKTGIYNPVKAISTFIQCDGCW